MKISYDGLRRRWIWTWVWELEMTFASVHIEETDTDSAIISIIKKLISIIFNVQK